MAIRRALWLLPLLGLVIWIYALVGSAGRPGSQWPVYMSYYDLQAEGFRSGHLYIPVAPHPELLEKANPYDPAHLDLWIWDATLYEGRYYMYWGPLPAALQALAKSLLRVDRLVGDQYLVFIFFSLCAILGALLIERMARRLFPDLPAVLLGFGIIAFAFANPVTHLVASGGVYQAAIASSQAFLLLGLVLAFDAVWQGPGERSLKSRLLLAGLAWGLALGCRISVGPVVVFFGVLTAYATGWAKGGWRRVLMNGSWMALPVSVASAWLLLYNKLRFDSWLDFGTGYQLSTMKFRFSSDYFLANLYSYALRPFESMCEFPQIRQVHNMGSAALPSWIAMPEGYQITEPLVGWLRVVPVTWAGVVAVVVALSWGRTLSRASHVPDEVSRRRRAYIWCAICFLVLGSVTGFVEMGLYIATMRYLGDVTNGLVLLGLLGAFTLYSMADRRALRSLVAMLLITGSMATTGFGLLLGYQGYMSHFARFNPELDARWRKVLSICAPEENSPGH